MDTKAKCPFCAENRQNGQMEVLAEAKHGLLIAAKDPEGVVTHGRYLIVPKGHIASILDLPPDWQESFAALLRYVPGFEAEDWNISINKGRKAGQRVMGHLHWWIINRENEEGLPSFETGLAGVVKKLNEGLVP
jgi:diadenosine tetraphosphate (Ap4A) HIT family hydrolase